MYPIKPHLKSSFTQKLDRIGRLCASYQQKCWKSVNFAHPFSSGVVFSGAAESHTLDPTSMATHGVGGFELTGSNTAVQPEPAHGTTNRNPMTLWASQKDSEVIPETRNLQNLQEVPISHITISFKIPLLINTNVIHKREASIRKNEWVS